MKKVQVALAVWWKKGVIKRPTVPQEIFLAESQEMQKSESS